MTDISLFLPRENRLLSGEAYPIWSEQYHSGHNGDDRGRAHARGFAGDRGELGQRLRLRNEMRGEANIIELHQTGRSVEELVTRPRRWLAVVPVVGRKVETAAAAGQCRLKTLRTEGVHATPQRATPQRGGRRKRCRITLATAAKSAPCEICSEKAAVNLAEKRNGDHQAGGRNLHCPSPTPSAPPQFGRARSPRSLGQR
jgi:hypothetical protein